jgi:hypothetical protein
MNAATKLALRRFALRWLRKLVDVADDRLHAAEMTLRNDLSGLRDRQHPPRAVLSTEDMLHQATDDRLRPRSESELLIRTEPLIDKGAFVEGSPSVPYETPTSYMQWEARCSGVAPVSKKEARKRRERQGAAAFDLRFAR